MSEDIKPVIWLIDDNPSELRTHRLTLLNALPHETPVTIEPIEARPHVGDYLDLLQNPRTVAIIVDQRLGDVKSGVDHTGIDLAAHLRSLDTKLPIYILTNYPEPDAFSNREWSVDDILSKETLNDEKELRTFIARLLRRIDVHQAILAERESRFRELLKIHINTGLSEEEQKEFDELQFARTAVVNTDETGKLARLSKALKTLKRLEAQLPDKD